MRNRLLTIAAALLSLAATAQTYDLNAPFGFCTRSSRTDASITYNLTGGGCYTYPVPDVCPNCGSNEIRGKGYGTEKIEDLLRDIFPEAHVARMDLDTTRSRNAYERIIDDFATGRTNVLIGTQMISKGLDFDKVSVVGILDADTMLNYPDFRSFEHAFMMMSQVSGRAGRKGKQGKTVFPDSESESRTREVSANERR